MVELTTTMLFNHSRISCRKCKHYKKACGIEKGSFTM